MNAWLSIVENSAARLFAAGVNLMVLFLTARELGPDGRGVFVVVTTWIVLFATLASLSLGQVSHHQIQERRDEEWLPRLAGTMLLVALVAVLVAFAVLAGLVLWKDGAVFNDVPRQYLVLAAALMPFLVFDEYARNLLAAAGRLRSYAVAQTVGNSLRLVLVVVALSFLGLGVGGVILAVLLSQIVIVAIEAQVLWRACGRRLEVSAGDTVSLLRGALRLHPNTVASFLLAQANVLLLNQFATKADVGLYQFAYQLVAAMVLLPQAAAMVLFGKIALQGPNPAWPDQKRLMLQVLAVLVVAALVAAAVVPQLIDLVVGPEFGPSGTIFRWLLPALLGFSLAEMMAPQWFGRGIFLTSTILTCLAATANLALNAILIQRYGILGAAWGTTISYLALVAMAQILFAMYCQKKYRREFSGRRSASPQLSR